MKRLTIRPQLRVREPEGDLPLERLITLLEKVQEYGNLQAACLELGLSYRGAWGRIKAAETYFGTPLLVMARGRGGSPTEFARRLLLGEKRLQARLGPVLDTLASELERELDAVLAGGPRRLRICASHGLAIAALLDFASRQQLPLEIAYRGSLEAVGTLAKGQCDMASFHVPTGARQAPVLQHYAPLLKGKSYLVADVASRRLGLMAARGNPLGISTLADVARTEGRFVNREPGSGTRMIFDLLLDEAGEAAQAIEGIDNVELTHAAVAAYIASGRADAGLGIEAVAAEFGLDFIPVLTERYCLIFPESGAHAVQTQALLGLMQSADYKRAVQRIPGYGNQDTGRVRPLREVFPELA